MELFEEIRRGYAAGETIKGLAKKHGVHRRMVRQAISAIPPGEENGARATETGSGERAHRPDAGRRSEGAAQAAAHGAPDLDAAEEEHPDQPIAEPTVRRYVQQRKQELGLRSGSVCAAELRLGPGGQVDWFEAVAKLDGEPCKLQFFAMRSMASGDAFHRAYTNATQQALLEAHEHAFDYFGGVFRTLRYDN